MEDQLEDEEQSTVTSLLHTRRLVLKRGELTSKQLRIRPQLQISYLLRILLMGVNALYQQV